MNPLPPQGTVVLCGTDFSDAAVAALTEARRVADRLGSVLVVLHVREESAGEAGTPAEGDWGKGVGVPHEHLMVRRGQPWAELVREARALNALQIVIGSHGRSGVQPLSLGSNATRIALSAPCPVLIVRPGGSHPRHQAVSESPHTLSTSEY